MEKNNNTDRISLSKVKVTANEKVIVPNSALGIDNNIVTYYQPKGVVAEQYRTLRTNIKRINKENPVKCIIMTSSIHNEGKSTTSVNLAVAMTYELDKKILLIDADLRKGRVHELFGLGNLKGLSNYLEGEATENDIVRKSPINGLDIVTCGFVPESPSELLGSKKMIDFLWEMEQKYDFIIIDTPPIIPLTDAAVLGASVDGVLIVAQAGRTKREVIHQSELHLTQAGCNILGYVLTNVEYYIPS
ncbi:MAG: CpsD/CapB family tyrosine-protein kinase, partial [bacterium]|nr:CpsD/CapB family tyrosine-protein kinase [bacterium]